MAIKRAAFFLATTAIVVVLLLPLAYGIATSLKTEGQLSAMNAPVLPSSPQTIERGGNSYDVYVVPFPDGGRKNLALVQKGRESSRFLDPSNPNAGFLEWKGSWRTLTPAWYVAPQWINFVSAWKTLDFLTLLLNTFMYACISTAGMLCSSAFVAYGFSRFNFPGKGAAFLVLMATIVLPPQVTLIPTYSFFFAIHWIGSWFPIIVPTFFANAFNVFLLRQFMMGVPRELDEAAKIDGAGPLRTFLSIIIPQIVPALIAVTLFHFFFCWNDFFGPLIYLAGKPNLSPISVGLTRFFNLYTRQANLVQAAALISTVIPLGIFLYTQKYFMQGFVVTGVEK
jgi:multiple sugar transport system permease protein